MNVSATGISQVYSQQGSSTNRSSSLSTEQQALIEDVLSKYDASSLSSEDATAIVEAFQEAGIEPSSALESAMSTVGFDAREVGDLAGLGQGGGGGGRMGPPPPPSEEELSTITELLESLLDSEEEEEDTTSVSTNPYDEDSFTSFNSILDYTSQIVNLKDSAKDDVMSILDEYNLNEDQAEIQQTVVNSLNDILKREENYNRISFYA